VNGWVVLVATIALIALSAFFVVIEFSLLGARRHRLEEQATTSRSARAALKGVNELTMMLAVAQLGITACTFALGAVTKPAVDAWLGPVFTSWGLVEWASDATAFALSLLVVTFLHLVVGEMAPKSWAIAHPELSARIIGIPSRLFVNVLRPLLRWVNAIANRLVAATGVEPVDRAAVGGQDADTIRQLVEHSAQAGVLEPEFRRQISGIIDLQSLVVESLVSADSPPTSVPASATGLAIGIALLFDAVTDPLAGSISDNWRSKWGRRHPFMLASAVPLGLCFAALFAPPASLGTTGLLVWLTVFAILTRTALTFYHVPHQALGAELSSDYAARTGVVA